MNIHKNAKTTPKMRAVIVARRQAGETARQIALAIGVSCGTVNKWLARHRCEGNAGLVDRSSRPRKLQTRATGDQRARVEALRRLRQPFWKIAAAVGLSRATVARIGKSMGLSHLSALDPKPKILRYEKETPGEMIHIDIKRLGRIEGVGHRITGDRTGQSNPRSRKEGGKGWDRAMIRHGSEDHGEGASGRRRPLTPRLFRDFPRRDPQILPDFPVQRPALFLQPQRQGLACDDGQRRKLSIPSLCQGIENAEDQTQTHEALHPQDQRQGRTVHPDFPTGVGLRPRLPALR